MLENKRFSEPVGKINENVIFFLSINYAIANFWCELKACIPNFHAKKSRNLPKTPPSGQIKGSKWLEGISGVRIHRKMKAAVWLALFWERKQPRGTREHCVTLAWAAAKETSEQTTCNLLLTCIKQRLIQKDWDWVQQGRNKELHKKICSHLLRVEYKQCMQIEQSPATTTLAMPHKPYFPLIFF